MEWLISGGILLFLGWIWDLQKKEDRQELISEIKESLKRQD